jgi:hypothetical protein
MPQAEDTQINLIFPGGESLKIDATDIDALIQSFLPIPEDSTYYEEFCRAFHKKFGHKISRTGAYLLIQAKHNMIEEVKKNSHLPLEWFGITDQESLTESTDDSASSSD